PAMPTRLSIAPNAPIHQNSIHYGMIVKIFLFFPSSISPLSLRNSVSDFLFFVYARKSGRSPPENVNQDFLLNNVKIAYHICAIGMDMRWVRFGVVRLGFRRTKVQVSREGTSWL
ncbi:MAG: hypothetical protein JW849_04090, partial [Phycisphaerae bacterium]|nr:hypothetical protein [Phycisphaerae bacterium]